MRGLAILGWCCLGACGGGKSQGGDAGDAPHIDGASRDVASIDAPVALHDHYIKASNTNAGDSFGRVAISADGSTLAVSASNEASISTGIDGNQSDNSLYRSGAVYVYVRSGDTWTQQAYIKAQYPTQGWFGFSLDLSDDGSTLVVGSPQEPAPDEDGVAYVFVRTGTTWTQEARLQPPDHHPHDWFGWSVTVSGDGTRVAIGAYGENSTGVPTMNQTFSGAAHVFARSGTTWSHEATIIGSGAASGDYSGWSTSLSSDGATLAVGAFGKNAAYVFTRIGTTWTEQAHLGASNAAAQDYFGASVALSGDGNTLAVGAFGEDSIATGIDGSQTNDAAQDSGAVYLFDRTGSTWAQSAYVKASNTGGPLTLDGGGGGGIGGDLFGTSVSLSADGKLLAVGAPYEASAAQGLNGDQSDNSAPAAGAVYLFTRGAAWAQVAYVKASNAEAGDGFGGSVAVANNALAAGAASEASSATGIDGNAQNNSAAEAGAAYVIFGW